MSTRWPARRSLGSSRSSSSNLPAARQREASSCQPSARNRYGWLHTLRSCMMTLLRPRICWPELERRLADPCVWISLYSRFCQPLISQRTTCSVFSGSWSITAALTRRSMNGRSTVCSRLMISSRSSCVSTSPSPPSPPPSAGAAAAPPNLAKGWENHWSKVSTELKMVGSRKFSSAHSSGRLFCSGVPVSSTRCLLWYCRLSVCANLDLVFFMRWPSSTMMYCQKTFFRAARSRMMYSYVVRTTLYCPDSISSR
mmetsp:Transcript_17032/g.25715  ORF Transcript_17032/g.25715 Transcript_17032/m.25715 type:complete len:255 (+) Transcript_17032:666-1430(+)